jgi:hypothetical protein
VQAVVLGLGQTIGVVGQVLQALPVAQSDDPALGPDRAIALEDVEGGGHTGPAYAQHHRQELVRDAELVALRPVEDLIRSPRARLPADTSYMAAICKSATVTC